MGRMMVMVLRVWRRRRRTEVVVLRPAVYNVYRTEGVREGHGSSSNSSNSSRWQAESIYRSDRNWLSRFVFCGSCFEPELRAF